MSPAVPAGSEDPLSLPERLAFPDDAVEVGRVLGAWGIKGGIRVMPFSKTAEALFVSRIWFIRPPESPTTSAGPRLAPAGLPYPPLLHVTGSKPQGDAVVATARELPDRNAAEAMKGARIFVPRSSFPTAGDGEFYWIDLIGLAVVNRQGEALGEVVGLIDTGPHSVLRIDPAVAAGAESDPADPAEERLIPFVAAYIDAVDLPARRISVDWGLDY